MKCKVSDVSNEKASDIPVVVIKLWNAVILPTLTKILYTTIQQVQIPRFIKDWQNYTGIKEG